ncbi:hypothetical protein OPQ81_000248 [Rhizoctonia solani]|nr:hypothetical protein OPQ81_000248 [Rhizoctonia solani]
MIKFVYLCFFSLLPVVAADIWGLVPKEPVGLSPNGTSLVRRQSCSSGYFLCSDMQGCCPRGGECCIDGCCGAGFRCVLGGCCPVGETCLGGTRGCSVAGTYPCPNENFCCPPGSTCYRDSASPTTTTSWTSYTAISYETILGMTYTYTLVVGEETTITDGIGMPTNIPAPARPTGSTSTNSPGAPAFTGLSNSETVNHFATSLLVLATGLCFWTLY